MALELTKIQLFEILETQGADYFTKKQWADISQDTTITEELIAKGYLDRLNWDEIKITKDFKEDFIKTYADKINYKIADFYVTDPDVVDAISKYAQMEDLFRLANLPNSFIQEHIEELSELEEFYLTQVLTPSILEENESKINWVLFSRNYEVDAEIFKNNIIRSNINYKELSFNDNATIITYDFVREHQDELDWNGISANIKLISNIDFLEEFRDKIAWDVVCKKESELSEEIRKKFDKKLKEGKEINENIPEAEEKEYDTASEMAAAKKPKISKFKFLMTTLLVDNLDNVPWELLSEQKLKFSFVASHLDANQLNINKVLKNNTYGKIDLCTLPWEELSSRITDVDVIIKHHDLIDFGKLDYQKIDLSRIPNEILLRHMDEIDIDKFTTSPSLTEEKVAELLDLATNHANKDGIILFEYADKFVSKFNVTDFISTHTVTNDFIEKNAQRIDWVVLSAYLTPEQAEEFSQNVFWKVITDGKNSNFNNIEAVKQAHPVNFSLKDLQDKFEEDKSKYNSHQSDIIRQVFGDGNINPELLLNPNLSAEQMKVLLSALRSNIDISDIANEDYTPEKMLKLIESKRMGIDVSQYDAKTSIERIMEDRYSFITGTAIQVTLDQNMFYSLGYSQRQSEEMLRMYESAKELYTQDFSRFTPEKIHFITEIYKYNETENKKAANLRTPIDLDEILKRDKLTAQDLELLLVSRQTHLTDPYRIDYIKMEELEGLSKEQKEGLIKGYKLGLAAKKYLDNRTGKELELYFDTIAERRNKTGKIKSTIQKMQNASHNLSQTFKSLVTLSEEDEIKQADTQETPLQENVSEVKEEKKTDDLERTEKAKDKEPELESKENEDIKKEQDVIIERVTEDTLEQDEDFEEDKEIIDAVYREIDSEPIDVDDEEVEEDVLVEDDKSTDKSADEIEQEEVEQELPETSEVDDSLDAMSDEFWDTLNEATESAKANLEYLQNLDFKRKEATIISLMQTTIIPNEEIGKMTNAEARLRLNRDILKLMNCIKIMESDPIMSKQTRSINNVKALLEMKELSIQMFLQERREEIQQAKNDIVEEVQQEQQQAKQEEKGTQTKEDKGVVDAVEQNDETITAVEDNPTIVETEENDSVTVGFEAQETTNAFLFEAIRMNIMEICGEQTNILATTNNNQEINFEISSYEKVYNVKIDANNKVSISSNNGEKIEEIKKCFDAFAQDSDSFEMLRSDLSEYKKTVTSENELKKDLARIFKGRDIEVEVGADEKNAVRIHLNRTEKSSFKFEYVVQLNNDGTIELKIKDAEKHHMPLSKKNIERLMSDKARLVDYFRFANISQLYEICTKDKTKEVIPEADEKNTSAPEQTLDTTPEQEYVKASVLLKDFKTMIEDNTTSIAILKEAYDEFMKNFRMPNLFGILNNDNTTSVVQNAQVVLDMIMDLLKMGVYNFKLKELAVKILDTLIEVPYDRSGNKENLDRLNKLIKEAEAELKQEQQKKEQEKNDKQEPEKKDKPKENEKKKDSQTANQSKNAKGKSKQKINGLFANKIESVNQQIAKAVQSVYGLTNPRSNDPALSSILQYERRPEYGKEISIIGKKDGETLRLTFSYETGELVDFKFGKQNASELSPEFIEDIKSKAQSIKNLITLHDTQCHFASSQSVLQEFSQVIMNETGLDLNSAVIDVVVGKELTNTNIQKNDDLYIQIQNVSDPENPDQKTTMLISEKGKIIGDNVSMDLQSTIKEFIEKNHSKIFDALRKEIVSGWHNIETVEQYEKSSANSKNQEQPNKESEQMVADAQQQTIDQRMDEMIDYTRKWCEQYFQPRGVSLSEPIKEKDAIHHFQFDKNLKHKIEAGTCKSLSENGTQKGILTIMPHVYTETREDGKSYYIPSCKVLVNGNEVFKPTFSENEQKVMHNSREDVYAQYKKALEQQQEKSKQKTKKRDVQSKESKTQDESR